MAHTRTRTHTQFELVQPAPASVSARAPVRGKDVGQSDGQTGAGVRARAQTNGRTDASWQRSLVALLVVRWLRSPAGAPPVTHTHTGSRQCKNSPTERIWCARAPRSPAQRRARVTVRQCDGADWCVRSAHTQATALSVWRVGGASGRAHCCAAAQRAGEHERLPGACCAGARARDAAPAAPECAHTHTHKKASECALAPCALCGARSHDLCVPTLKLGAAAGAGAHPPPPPPESAGRCSSSPRAPVRTICTFSESPKNPSARRVRLRARRPAGHLTTLNLSRLPLALLGCSRAPCRRAGRPRRRRPIAPRCQSTRATSILQHANSANNKRKLCPLLPIGPPVCVCARAARCRRRCSSHTLAPSRATCQGGGRRVTMLPGASLKGHQKHLVGREMERRRQWSAPMAVCVCVRPPLWIGDPIEEEQQRPAPNCATSARGHHHSTSTANWRRAMCTFPRSQLT